MSSLCYFWLQEVWEKQWGALDRYNLVRTEQYLENMQHVLNDPSLKRKVHQFLPYLFKVNYTRCISQINVQYFTFFVLLYHTRFNIRMWIQVSWSEH
jgi:hypothetical protein